jgi:Phage tail tube protein
MAFNQGSRTGISYVVESTYGVTPATPSLLQLPILSSDIDVTKQTYDSNDILPDRQLRLHRHGTRSVAGKLEVDMRKAVYDDFLESAMYSTWATNVLKIGTTQKSFSIEEASEDIVQYRLFTGLVVNQMSMDVRPNANVKTTFDLVGKDVTVAGTSVDAVKTPATANQPHDSFSGFIKLSNAGSAGVAVTNVTAMNFMVNNDVSQTFTVGALTTPQLEYGRASVTGELTAYFEDASLLNRFLNETETAIELQIGSPTATSSYNFLFPRVKFDGAKLGLNTLKSRSITIPFVALYDTTEASVLKITRNLA